MTTATATIGILPTRYDTPDTPQTPDCAEKSRTSSEPTHFKNFRPWGSDQVDSVSIVSYLPSLVFLRERELPRRRARFYVLSRTAR